MTEIYSTVPIMSPQRNRQYQGSLDDGTLPSSLDIAIANINIEDVDIEGADAVEYEEDSEDFQVQKSPRYARLTALALGLLALVAIGLGIYFFLDKNEYTLRKDTTVNENFQEVVSFLAMAEHGEPEDCWMTIHGKVYDMTEYAPVHPGAPTLITRHCGTDATRWFDFDHTVAILPIVDKYLLGDLLLEETEAPTDTDSPAISTAETTVQVDLKQVAELVTSTDTPTSCPTSCPTNSPTNNPTNSPTNSPSVAPTEAPTAAPTVTSSTAPTLAPTLAPTEAPTEAPTVASSTGPSVAPTEAPTEAPTVVNSAAPTLVPTEAPTLAPISLAPTPVPTLTQTFAQTSVETYDQSFDQSFDQTSSPSNATESPTNTTSPTSATVTDTDTETEVEMGAPTFTSLDVLLESYTTTSTGSATAAPVTLRDRKSVV